VKAELIILLASTIFLAAVWGAGEIIYRNGITAGVNQLHQCQYDVTYFQRELDECREGR
jgi:hypothetical protein